MRAPPLLLAVFLLAAALTACAQDTPTCAPPYIANGATCCPDKDADGVCDATVAAAAPGLDCSVCPPKFVTQVEEKIVYKYVCADGSVRDAKEQCPEGPASNAKLFRENEQQDDTLITAFTARPACRGEHQAAELHLAVSQTPQRVSVLAQTQPGGAFSQIGTIEGTSAVIDDEYFYIGFCAGSDCEGVTDATLPADTTSVVRAVLEYPDRNVTTRDRLLDPSATSEYGRKKC